MRRLATSLIVAAALHAALLAVLRRTPNVVARTKASVRITIVAPPPVAPPEEKRARSGPRASPVAARPPAPPTTSASAPAPASAPPAPVIDLRRPPSLAPTQQTLLDAMAPPDSPPTTESGGSIVILDDDWTSESVADALAQALDGRRIADGARSEEPLVLRRHPDGTLRHEAKKFTAIIREDGSVRFIEKLDVAAAPGPFVGNGRSAHQNAVGDPTLAEVLRKSAVEESSPASARVPLLSGVFDINAPLQRLAGNDPLAHEKTCFLDETRALRESLAQESRGLAEARALHALDQQLAAILASNIALSAKKRAIFDLWADCSLENGGRARHRIELFVRERMPRGSTLAFSDDELDALNATIDAGEAFAPYG